MTIRGGENPETVPKPHKTSSLVKRETLAIIIILSRVCRGEQVWLRWPVITRLGVQQTQKIGMQFTINHPSSAVTLI